MEDITVGSGNSDLLDLSEKHAQTSPYCPVEAELRGEAKRMLVGAWYVSPIIFQALPSYKDA